MAKKYLNQPRIPRALTNAERLSQETPIPISQKTITKADLPGFFATSEEEPKIFAPKVTVPVPVEVTAGFRDVTLEELFAGATYKDLLVALLMNNMTKLSQLPTKLEELETLDGISTVQAKQIIARRVEWEIGELEHGN